LLEKLGPESEEIEREEKSETHGGESLNHNTVMYLKVLGTYI